MVSVDEKIAQENIVLPDTPAQSGHYLLTKQVGNLLYISGITSKWNGHVQYKGKLGESLPVEAGYEAAKVCGLNLLAIMKEELGDLNNVKQIVKLVGYVNCRGDFGDIPKVVNGASDLLTLLYGRSGEHSRCAVGVNSLPGNASVEVDLIVELRDKNNE